MSMAFLVVPVGLSSLMAYSFLLLKMPKKNPSLKGAPTAAAFKASAKTAKKR
jgi:hypothetical protein